MGLGATGETGYEARNVEIMELLMEYCADVKNEAVLVRVCQDPDCCVGVEKLLIGNGAKIDVAEEFGKTALMFAVAAGIADVIRVLFASGADTSLAYADGVTALTIATEREKKGIVTLPRNKQKNESKPRN